jgi:hypothetical protein
MPRLTVKHEAQLLFKAIAFASHRFLVPSMRWEAEASKRIDELRARSPRLPDQYAAVRPDSFGGPPADDSAADWSVSACVSARTPEISSRSLMLAPLILLSDGRVPASA